MKLEQINNRINSTQLKMAAVLIALVLSVVLLVVNRGFNYTSFAPSYVINVTGEQASAAVSALVGKPGVARVDRDKASVYFQKISLNSFNQTVTELKEKFKDQGDKVVISSYFETPTPIFVTGSNQTIFVLTIVILLFLFRRTVWSKLDKQDRSTILAVWLLSFFALSVLVVGLLSGISTFIMISEFTVYLAILGLVLVGITVFIALLSYVASPQRERADAAMNNLSLIFSERVARMNWWLTIGIVLLMFSLGYRIILDGAIFLIIIWLGSASLQPLNLIWFRLFHFDWQHVGGQINVRHRLRNFKLPSRKK